MNTSPKYKNAILFLLQELGGTLAGKKKLAKLLYYIDFDFFEWKGESVTNEVYFSREMGPLGAQLHNVIKELEQEGKIMVSQQEVDGYQPSFVYSVNAKPDLQVFSEDETKMIQRVVKKYGLLNGKQLEDLTHNEAPYMGTEPNQEIDYELSIYRGTEFNELG